MYDRARRAPRVTLPEPQQARVGRQPAFVRDVSMTGLGLAQQDHTAAIGQPRRVSIEWHGRSATFVCEMRWLRPDQRSMYLAGYQVVHGTAEGYEILRQMMKEYASLP